MDESDLSCVHVKIAARCFQNIDTQKDRLVVTWGMLAK